MPLKLEGHHARKRFGQNFLNDRHWIGRIIDSIDPRPGEALVEIGPGQAALTKEVIGRAGHETAVEIDRDLAAWLRGLFTEAELTLIEADALALDWRSIFPGRKLRIFGNLPYNISSPILFALAAVADRVEDQHFMLQREVVERMVCPPGSRTYGRLSAMLQRSYRMEKLFDVPPGAFTPSPKVTSSVVRMVPLARKPGVDDELYAEVVAAAFGMRRKTLRNALSKLLSVEQIELAGIDPGARAETLSVGQFEALAAALGRARA
ncbi:16S rRNA (adenine(1518)-N(6)/adenine(1519)-N(6))-dimethyltransferase RsmA [Mesosutterella sp. OilRF-GAM-744-9]|uniref:Ribosomal RNA small subunit methyltransferase A n=1 Tax=Mesosutterella porci TaxID=2915351 RepID=A0ABS9MPS5_9BURK|nr:16S rRNA (adenine(1518)-N(6)/adenine(1519)-N(6))-dimethyltransferase RsmA [Mesosutterella sp. oilRF-744-WT-GAM-9]MCG5030270.1 16S rRNA (adenine(1518)-N(6)/adenine(1519)-N(6))-dimethyltransferase RsmA [Mesosutterella sp. oilRF-744-WT-GAM-9]